MLSAVVADEPTVAQVSGFARSGQPARGERGATETVAVMAVTLLFIMVAGLVSVFFARAESDVGIVSESVTPESEAAGFFFGCFNNISSRQVMAEAVAFVEDPDNEGMHIVTVDPFIREQEWGADIDGDGEQSSIVREFSVETRLGYPTAVTPQDDENIWFVAKNPVRVCWDLILLSESDTLDSI